MVFVGEEPELYHRVAGADHEKDRDDDVEDRQHGATPMRRRSDREFKLHAVIGGADVVRGLRLHRRVVKVDMHVGDHRRRHA